MCIGHGHAWLYRICTGHGCTIEPVPICSNSPWPPVPWIVVIVGRGQRACLGYWGDHFPLVILPYRDPTLKATTKSTLIFYYRELVARVEPERERKFPAGRSKNGKREQSRWQNKSTPVFFPRLGTKQNQKQGNWDMKINKCLDLFKSTLLC